MAIVSAAEPRSCSHLDVRPSATVCQHVLEVEEGAGRYRRFSGIGTQFWQVCRACRDSPDPSVELRLVCEGCLRRVERRSDLWGSVGCPRCASALKMSAAAGARLVVGVHGHLNYPGEFALRCKAMEIDWMTNDKLVNAVPPAYTTHLGAQLLALLRAIPT
ncbi:MAG: hypothetical protein CYG61_05490 [Actinobacteria bacterium]|nr:MAG: hypothetical protein CYG61_05490 [Actinomycetota bacterium]